MWLLWHSPRLRALVRACACTVWGASGSLPISVLFQMYITSTIKTKSSRLAKPVLCLGTLCMAFLTGLNRVSEYRNHCSDVIAGFILGTAVALFLVSQLPSFSLSCPLRGCPRPWGIRFPDVQSTPMFLWPEPCELQLFSKYYASYCCRNDF